MTHFFYYVIFGLVPKIHINITIPTNNSVRTAVLPHWVSLCLNLKFVPQARFQIAIFSGLTREAIKYGLDIRVKHEYDFLFLDSSICFRMTILFYAYANRNKLRWTKKRVNASIFRLFQKLSKQKQTASYFSSLNKLFPDKFTIQKERLFVIAF